MAAKPACGQTGLGKGGNSEWLKSFVILCVATNPEIKKSQNLKISTSLSNNWLYGQPEIFHGQDADLLTCFNFS